jgi:hypothetical protein
MSFRPSAAACALAFICASLAFTATACPKVIRGSEESKSERTARLKRECKGAVNAGACLGYTK